MISNKTVSLLGICIKISYEIILAPLTWLPPPLPPSVWCPSQQLSSVLCPTDIFSRASVHTPQVLSHSAHAGVPVMAYSGNKILSTTD